MGTDYTDASETAANGIYGNVLSYLLTNLPEDPLDSWSAGDPDWQEKGVFRPFWQPDYLTSNIWENDSLAPLGYIFYPEQCYDGTTQCRLHVHILGT